MIRTTPTRALSEIRLLCTQGLAPQAVVPAATAIVRRWIPNSWSSFLFVNEQLQPAAVYADAPEIAGLYQRYLDHYCNTQQEGQVGIRLQDGMSSGPAVSNSASLGKRFLESEYFNEVYVPMRIKWGLVAPVRTRGGGALMLFRAPTDPGFAELEERGLARVASYLRHSFEAPSRPAETYANDGEEGIVVMDRRARVLHWSSRASFLLHWVSAENGPLDVRAPFNAPAVRQLLHGLLRDLLDPQGPTPVRTVVNSWGQFTLRAYELHPQESGHVGISVRLRSPIAAALLSHADGWPLAPKHLEVCLCLLRGLTYQEAARAMSLKVPTVIGYAREAFARLGVGNREELLRTLLSGDTREPGIRHITQ